jgi:hypothetical protein
LLVTDVCSGWLVELHPLGGGPPDAGYSIGPCPNDPAAPAWAGALPTLPPHP